MQYELFIFIGCFFDAGVYVCMDKIVNVYQYVCANIFGVFGHFGNDLHHAGAYTSDAGDVGFASQTECTINYASLRSGSFSKR